MVCFAIVGRSNPAQSRLKVAASSRNLGLSMLKPFSQALEFGQFSKEKKYFANQSYVITVL